MIKVGIAANGDPKDMRTWSRTPLRIIESFEKLNNYKVNKTINLSDLCNMNVSFFHRILRKFIYERGSLRDPIKFKKCAKKIKIEISKLDSDVCIFCAEHAMFNKIENTRCYAYIDAILRPKYELIKDKRLLNKTFLKIYEENEKISFENMDGIFTLNQWTKDYLINEYKIEKSKIYNVGFGINTELYYGDKNYNNKKMLIILREGTEYGKGLWLLLDAFKILKRTINDATLEVVGVKEKKHIEGVNYYYNQPREKTLELFKECSLFVMPNILEVNGIVYIEALANKIPIVGLNRFAFPEFCGYGEWGYICQEENEQELAKVLLNALSNPNKLEEMGKKGQKFVEKRYSWDNVVRQMTEVIEKKAY